MNLPSTQDYQEISSILQNSKKQFDKVLHSLQLRRIQLQLIIDTTDVKQVRKDAQKQKRQVIALLSLYDCS